MEGGLKACCTLSSSSYKRHQAQMVRQGIVPDSVIISLIDKHPNSMIGWWLMAGYLYNIRNESLMTDDLYDKIGTVIKEKWETLEHPHKYLITERNLLACSTYNIKESEYPLRCKVAALTLLEYGYVDENGKRW